MAGISGGDRGDRRAERQPLRVGRVVVIGGGCYGAWYAQQLARASAKGALTVGEVVVVDRDPACRVAVAAPSGVYGALPLRVETATWDTFLGRWLALGPEALRDDAIVPSPLMPHLFLDWLVRRATDRWPERSIAVEPLRQAPPTPWERAAPDGRHYVSFATWTCPVNCIEPATCPATRSERDWSMPGAMAAFAAGPEGLDRAVMFHCEHRTYGVGMIDAATVAMADRQLAAWGADGPVRVLVGTVSHCHGALGVLAVT